MWAPLQRRSSQAACATHPDDIYGETYNAKGESCSDLSSDDRIALAAGLSFAAALFVTCLAIWTYRFVHKRRKRSRVRNESAARVMDEKRSSATTPFLVPRARMPWGAKAADEERERERAAGDTPPEWAFSSESSHESANVQGQGARSPKSPRSRNSVVTSPNPASDESFTTAQERTQESRVLMDAEGFLQPNSGMGAAAGTASAAAAGVATPAPSAPPSPGPRSRPAPLNIDAVRLPPVSAAPGSLSPTAVSPRRERAYSPYSPDPYGMQAFAPLMGGTSAPGSVAPSPSPSAVSSPAHSPARPVPFRQPPHAAFGAPQQARAYPVFAHPPPSLSPTSPLSPVSPFGAPGPMTPTTPAPVLQQTQQGQGEEAQVERAGGDPGWMNGFLSRLPSTRRAPTHVDGPVVHSVHIVQHDEQPEDYFHHAYVGSANASNTDLVDPRYHSQDEK